VNKIYLHSGRKGLRPLACKNEAAVPYFVVAVGLWHVQRAEAISNGVLVGEHLVAVLIGVDRGDHANEVLEQACTLVFRDNALHCEDYSTRKL